MSETTTQTTEAIEQPVSIFEQPLSDAPALVIRAGLVRVFYS